MAGDICRDCEWLVLVKASAQKPLSEVKSFCRRKCESVCVVGEACKDFQLSRAPRGKRKLNVRKKVSYGSD